MTPFLLRLVIAIVLVSFALMLLDKAEACPTEEAISAYGLFNYERGRQNVDPAPWSYRLSRLAREHQQHASCAPGGHCTLQSVGNVHGWYPDCASDSCRAKQARERVGYPGPAYEVLCGGPDCARRLLASRPHWRLLMDDWRALGVWASSGMLNAYMGAAEDKSAPYYPLLQDSFE